MKIKNQSSIPSKYWLAIIAVICVILLGIDQVTDGGGPLRFIGDYTVVPMQKGISYVGRWLSDLSDNFETLQDMKKQNETLQSKVDELTIDNTRLRQDEYELERLRDLYKLDQNYSDYEKIGAHVIANNGTNWFSDFTIDKGSADGIKVNCNVLAGSGLVGLVTEVGPHYARVRSIIDNSSNVSAMILSTSDTCIVRGDLKLMDDGRLRFEKLANNDNDIKVGEQVVAIGNALGYGQSVTTGIVSATDRTLSSSDSSDSNALISSTVTTKETPTYIQTDAAINPGNSGGALVNSKGEVIGINTAKYNSSMAEGMGYAIPSNQIKPTVESLLETGTQPQPYIGITGTNASLYNLEVGALVLEVKDNSPAAAAGLKSGDIITQFNGKTIKDMDSLLNAMDSSDIGKKVDLTVVRDNKDKIKLQLTVADKNS